MEKELNTVLAINMDSKKATSFSVKDKDLSTMNEGMFNYRIEEAREVLGNPENILFVAGKLISASEDVDYNDFINKKYIKE